MAFPEIGRVRKGAKKTDNAPGRDLTYFRVEFDEKETEAAALFHAKYKEQPTEINVILPFDEIERCWDAWLEAYTAGRMVARSDGEKYLYLVNTDTGEVVIKNGYPERAYKENEVIGTWRNRKTGKDEPIKCKPAGRLKVIIPELARAAYLTVLTGSIHDIANISAQLAAFKAVNNGRIAGIPLVLRRRPKPISTPKPDGSRARYIKWMLSIEADPQWVKAMLMESKRLALPGNGTALLETGEIPSAGPEWEDAQFVDENEEEPFSEAELDRDIEPLFDEEIEQIPTMPTDSKSVVYGVPPMIIDEARNVTNRDGLRYGDIPTDKLAHMANNLSKIAKRTPEQETKLLAIQLIIEDRHNATADQESVALGDVAA
jgi:hypothetical protein